MTETLALKSGAYAAILPEHQHCRVTARWQQVWNVVRVEGVIEFRGPRWLRRLLRRWLQDDLRGAVIPLPFQPAFLTGCAYSKDAGQIFIEAARNGAVLRSSDGPPSLPIYFNLTLKERKP